MINIYTDGACSGNPGPGGWATVIEYSYQLIIVSNSLEYTTNNQMELTAISNALQYIFDNQNNHELTNEQFTIYTDSAYVANCFKDKWYIKWERNNWTNSKKEKVKNKDLWIKIIALYKLLEPKIKIEKVAGHADNILNNLADKYAVLASKGEVHNEICLKSNL